MAKAATPTIAFVTVSKGRLHHLKETLPPMLAQRPDELIVVDYSCPDGSGDWVEAEFPQAKVVRQPGEAAFNISKARNIGAAAAASEWLFFVDADVLCGEGLGDWLRANLEPKHFYRPEPLPGDKDHAAWGTFACMARDFAAVGGYDEVFEGWGTEDSDLYRQLVGHGAKESLYPGDTVVPIEHDDSQRHLLPGLTSRWQNQAINACYADAKKQIALARGGPLPLAEREQIMAISRKAVRQWYAAGASQPMPVRFIVKQDGPRYISREVALATQWTLTVLLQPTQRGREDRAKQQRQT